MNSYMQALFMSKEFRHRVLDIDLAQLEVKLVSKDGEGSGQSEEMTQ